MSSKQTLDISWGTILKISAVAILLYVLYLIRSILIWFIFALIISILFNPAINFLRKFRIPRVLAVCFVYIAFFGVFSLIIYSIIPLFVSEISQFSQFLPQYFEKISPPLKELGFNAFSDLESFFGLLEGALNKIAANILNVLFIFFGGVMAATFIMALSIYLSIDEKGMEKALLLFFPKKYETYILSLWEGSQKKVNSWFATRILACLFVGIVSLIAFLIFNTGYPFSLALIAGVLNFIPIVGPVLTGVLLFIVVAIDNISKAVFVVIVFVLIQQIENNILTPLLSKKFVGLSPILVLLSLAIGGILWGFLGAILSIPLAGILSEFLKDFLKKKKETA